MTLEALLQNITTAARVYVDPDTGYFESPDVNITDTFVYARTPDGSRYEVANVENLNDLEYIINLRPCR